MVASSGRGFEDSVLGVAVEDDFAVAIAQWVFVSRLPDFIQGALLIFAQVHLRDLALRDSAFRENIVSEFGPVMQVHQIAAGYQIAVLPGCSLFFGHHGRLRGFSGRRGGSIATPLILAVRHVEIAVRIHDSAGEVAPPFAFPLMHFPMSGLPAVTVSDLAARAICLSACMGSAHCQSAGFIHSVASGLNRFRKSRMRQRRLDHLDGNQSVDVLRAANLNASLNPARDMRDFHPARPGSDMLTAARLPRRPGFGADVFRVDKAAHRGLWGFQEG
jgi:hypothetical protein